MVVCSWEIYSFGCRLTNFSLMHVLGVFFDLGCEEPFVILINIIFASFVSHTPSD